jgi:hypothetical protein
MISKASTIIICVALLLLVQPASSLMSEIPGLYMDKFFSVTRIAANLSANSYYNQSVTWRTPIPTVISKCLGAG